MKYETARFGSIAVQGEDIILFPEALYGFDQEKEFVLLPLDPNIDSPMEWLQSLRTPELAFIVTDPFLFIPQYNMVLNDEEKDQLKVESTESVVIRVIGGLFRRSELLERHLQSGCIGKDGLRCRALAVLE